MKNVFLIFKIHYRSKTFHREISFKIVMKSLDTHKQMHATNAGVLRAELF